ncbi:MAG TPA: type 4a pilus biogenesis protein PilO [Anaeromyxobacteraceae bacterium]|nr:type 4a pilus biogenesis protein PilO [Anaeromyxobacteraceae bacterium]
MEKLIERIAKAPVGTKVAVVMLVACGITALNYFVMGVPSFGASISEMEGRIERTGNEQRKLDQDYIEKQAIANNLNQFRREKELLEARLNEALAELPNDKRLDELLQLFQDRATKAGIDILTIEPQGQANEGFYARIPVPMTVQGGYHEIATFLDAIGRLRRIVNVSNLALDTPHDVNGKVTLTGRFLATTFMFVDTKAAPGATKP